MSNNLLTHLIITARDINIDQVQLDPSVSVTIMGNHLGAAGWTSEDVDREIKEAVGTINREIQHVLTENGEKFFRK